MASQPDDGSSKPELPSQKPGAAEADHADLPERPKLQRQATMSSDEFQSADEGEDEGGLKVGAKGQISEKKEQTKQEDKENGDKAASLREAPNRGGGNLEKTMDSKEVEKEHQELNEVSSKDKQKVESLSQENPAQTNEDDSKPSAASESETKTTDGASNSYVATTETNNTDVKRSVTPSGTRKDRVSSRGSSGSPAATRRSRAGSSADPKTEIGGVSEWSHQALAPPKEETEVEEDFSWQAMPTDSKMDYYDDFGHLVAKADKNLDDDDFDPVQGGAGRGYTRVQLDDDAQSATSMDEHTAYLFKNKGISNDLQDEEGDEEARDPLAQMQATKDLLTEGQRIAYVGVVRLSMEEMRKEMSRMEVTKKFKKDFNNAIENMQMWRQKMMVRLYAHMDISSSEQVMIEQLAEHGIKPSDMTQALMQNARVKNPLAAPKPTVEHGVEKTSKPEDEKADQNGDQDGEGEGGIEDPPPPYTEEEKNHVPEAIDPSTLEKKDHLDIDLRWTVLCDLFLVLIADSIYDARSRVLLERVGEALEIPWLEVCRFEKRVTDALEMQEEAFNENWDEAETVEHRRKLALKKKYLMMGLATAGGGLLIGLSAGLLAPVIGAGLAAGFSAVGVAGTSSFLAGAGGATIITATSAIAGGSIGIKASSRRMGAVKTFEYRPLHNNKRVNLILTVSGWMTGQVDDVRLPFSTVDPIMGDIYSLHYEPEMLMGVGDTVRILATEALTQGLQQILAATALSVLMAGLTAPLILSKISYLIDNPWSSSLDRAERAGLILADSIIDRHLGIRPITLVGFSLGAKVIFSCLSELSSRGAYGLVQNVYIFGSPVVANQEQWLRVRTVISGRFVNGYASNDWILGYFFRGLSGGIQRVAGLASVDNVPGVENFSCSEIVNGHMAYRAAMPRLLREVGWDVVNDEFTEIEDPDPENHEARQRELIQEIEDAREAAAKEPKKSWWGNKKKTQKKGWETYDSKSKEAGPGRKSGDEKDNPGSVIFDIDAIRRELESEHMEVKQLESTLPPMQLNLEKPADKTPEEKSPTSAKTTSLNPFSALRGTKSYNNASDSPSQPAATKSTSTNATANGGTSPKPEKESKTKEKKKSMNMYDYDEDEDVDPTFNGGVTMSFDRPPSPDDGDGDVGFRRGSDQRPPLKSSATAPASGLGAAGAPFERNAWAEDDETHGEEGEITMTFA